jgi:hypothetical protein
MAQRYEITISPPRNEDKIGLQTTGVFPIDGGAVSPAEMSGFFLPGAAGHPGIADPRNAAVTLTPSPRPMVGDFFCPEINPITINHIEIPDRVRNDKELP